MARSAAYKIIQDDILEHITNGKLSAGARIPTEAELMKKYNVSRITVQRALSALKLQGVITRKPRAGTFVLSPAPKPVFSPEKSSDRINIGVVAPFGMESPGIYQYLDGILSALSVPRDNLSLHNACYVEAYDRTMLENCLKDNCSGIIYYPGLSSAPPLDLLTQMSVEGYPCVLIDKRIPGIELPCVQSNNVLGERAVVEHLIELGHRSIVFAAGSYTMSVYERYEGFCRAMHDAGLGRLDRMYCSLTALEDDRSAMVEQVRAWIHSGVTAVCCSADSHAKRLADLCGEIHVDIPRQLAIAGFDGVYRGSITSVLQPYARIGRVATETLLKWILTGDVNREVVEMDAQFLPGASTLPNDEAADAQST